MKKRVWVLVASLFAITVASVSLASTSPTNNGTSNPPISAPLAPPANTIS